MPEAAEYMVVRNLLPLLIATMDNSILGAVGNLAF